ncbi:MAG: cytochrome P450 [Candidatus Symbiobacter sp.]|nr:cytochrome P450 [Candidatus Symbiobacter sp.]
MTSFIAKDAGQIDLADHDSFTQGVPFNYFAELRRNDPMHWQEMKGGKGFWSLTRHQDILQWNRNYQLLSSAQGIRLEDQSHEEYMARRTFQETDPPDHTRLRMIVSKAFSRPVVLEFEAQIRAICQDIIQTIAGFDEIDGVKQVARQLPMRMLGQILGAPEQDFEWLVEKGDQLIANSDPEFTQFVLDKANTDAYRFMPFRSPAGLELFDYAKQLMASKEAKGDDKSILHLVLQPDDQGNRITQEEFRNFFCLLVAAGNDTTRYSIAASLYALANRPSLFAQLQENLKIGVEGNPFWDRAADEFIRWASPTMHFRRTATQDFELHGKKVKQGDKVVFWFVAGNRDEQVFADPSELDLTRDPNPHIAFGQGGPHVCLGMWLARLEVRVLLQEWAKHVAEFEQAAPHQYLRSNFIGGIKHLPLKLRVSI